MNDQMQHIQCYMHGRLWVMLLLLLIPFLAPGQSIESKVNESRQGKWFALWGWNRGWYSDSDLTLKGDNYRIRLHDVKATDRPISFDLDKYFNPAKMSTPQFNFQFGYYIRERWAISFGLDHMKYVMTKNQYVTIDGRIDDDESRYHGAYESDEILLHSGFLEYEHTDGLNYLNIGLRHEDLLWRSGSFNLLLLEGVAAGVVLPRTDATLMGQERHDKYHLSGYGANLSLGVQFSFLKHFFIQSEWKGGYINLPDVRTTYNSSDKAQQHFYFMQFNWSAGAVLRL